MQQNGVNFAERNPSSEAAVKQQQHVRGINVAICLWLLIDGLQDVCLGESAGGLGSAALLTKGYTRQLFVLPDTF